MNLKNQCQFCFTCRYTDKSEIKVQVCCSVKPAKVTIQQMQESHDLGGRGYSYLQDYSHLLQCQLGCPFCSGSQYRNPESSTAKRPSNKLLNLQKCSFPSHAVSNIISEAAFTTCNPPTLGMLVLLKQHWIVLVHSP